MVAAISRWCYLAAMKKPGDRGCYRVRAGHLVMHGAFEAHLNRYYADGSEVLNLALPTWMEPSMVLMQAPDPDAAVHLAEHDPKEGVAFLLETAKLLPSHALAGFRLALPKERSSRKPSEC
jgi:hypothetical protein